MNQVILAKKRRLSQTDIGKSRKPTAQAPAVASVTPTPVMVSDARQDVVVNGDDGQVHMDLTTKEPSQPQDDASHTKHPAVANETAKEVTSPQETHQPTASYSSKIHN